MLTRETLCLCAVRPAGKKWIDAAVDLPFALPTSVAGLTLATVYGEEGILGRFLINMGVNVVYTRLGVAVAMIFVSFPFVVRTMQPVLQVRGVCMGLQEGVQVGVCMQLNTALCTCWYHFSRRPCVLSELPAWRLCCPDHICMGR